MKFVYLPILILLGGCAIAGVENPTAQELAADKGYLLGDEVKEIYNYRVDGWNHVSDRALIINAGPGTRYLLTLKNPCHYLSSAEVIGYTTTTNRLTRFDGVLVEDPPGGVDQKCFIERMYELKKAEKSEE